MLLAFAREDRPQAMWLINAADEFCLQNRLVENASTRRSVVSCTSVLTFVVHRYVKTD